MTVPFGADTYVTWDFDEVWDSNADVNDGFPFLR